MKAAIMQPYFMPYLGYFALINCVDKFIIFDTPQFIRHGWIERNKILKPNGNGDTMYIKVPLVKHSRDTVIKDILINNTINWKQKIISQFDHYKKKAPYYKNVISILDSIFEEEYENVVDLNVCTLRKVNDYLGIKTPISIWSQMDVEIENVIEPDEWALNICKAMNIQSYVNLPGGRSFFNKEKYDSNGVELNFLEINISTYSQFEAQFTPFLSILDVLMFNHEEEINTMIKQIKLST